jgi:hypothetical protein
MAAMIRQVLEASETDRAAMAQAGHARLHARYGQAMIVDAYLSLYHTLLAEKTGSL